tara:strand:+ start:367 stop:561 length:195 start_codon:yes stop_codon:yes gene_type:complete
MTQPSKLFLTIEEVAELCRVTPLTIHRWRKDKPSFPNPYRPGKHLLYALDEVVEYIKQSEEKNG